MDIFTTPSLCYDHMVFEWPPYWTVDISFNLLLQKIKKKGFFWKNVTTSLSQKTLFSLKKCFFLQWKVEMFWPYSHFTKDICSLTWLSDNSFFKRRTTLNVFLPLTKTCMLKSTLDKNGFKKIIMLTKFG